MTLHHPGLISWAVSVDEAPSLASRLDIRGVPVIFVGRRRYDGPLAEWVFAQQLALQDPWRP